MPITPEALARFDEASNHPYECRCEICLEWWQNMGGPEHDATNQRRPHMTRRYHIYPIADENCDSLNTDELLVTARNRIEAGRLADHYSRCSTFGAGILDTVTGDIDVGFGMGVPCPDFSE